MKRVALLALTSLLLVGCAGDDNAAEETTDTEVTLPASSTGRVYWLRDGKVWPVQREIQASGDAATAVMGDLVAGPSPQEQEELGFTTAIPAGATPDVTVHDGVATVELGAAVDPSPEALAQIVYTLTALPGVLSVTISGVMTSGGGFAAASYTRTDFEEQTPSVLVESPLPFEEVASPFTATGTANTFEATFAFTIEDDEGNLLTENFVTATSGTGTRGTFEFTGRSQPNRVRRDRPHRLRELRRGRLADERGRDPADRGAVGRAAYSLHVADAPWRCSRCGTVNEPVANACRTCGRWPSLFELEGSTLETEPQASKPPPELYEPDVVEVDYAEPETLRSTRAGRAVRRGGR